MRITIASRQLAFMFPAYMVVDNQLVLQDVSPMLTEREYPPRIGDNLLDHFQLAHRQSDAPTATVPEFGSALPLPADAGGEGKDYGLAR